MKRKDPTSHRIIEKRRRDRMNNRLADLSKLIPSQYMRNGRGRLEKTEIIEMAIRHLKDLIQKSKEHQSQQQQSANPNSNHQTPNELASSRLIAYSSDTRVSADSIEAASRNQPHHHNNHENASTVPMTGAACEGRLNGSFATNIIMPTTGQCDCSSERREYNDATATTVSTSAKMCRPSPTSSANGSESSLSSPSASSSSGSLYSLNSSSGKSDYSGSSGSSGISSSRISGNNGISDGESSRGIMSDVKGFTPIKRGRCLCGADGEPANGNVFIREGPGYVTSGVAGDDMSRSRSGWYKKAWLERSFSCPPHRGT